jgi:hydrogenase-4 component E
MIYFIVAFFAVYTGMFMIISHKKIFSHLVGFLVIENAVLLLSLAIGSEMPMLINIGILLDIFVSVLILGIFVMKLKQTANELTRLKDD